MIKEQYNNYFEFLQGIKMIRGIINQKSIAVELGVSYSTVRNYVMGRAKYPSPKLIDDIAKAAYLQAKVIKKNCEAAGI